MAWGSDLWLTILVRSIIGLVLGLAVGTLIGKALNNVFRR